MKTAFLSELINSTVKLSKIKTVILSSMASPAGPRAAPVPGAAPLVLENLAVGFHDKSVLSGVNVSLAAGEILALAGPNGGGKTTLLKTAAGFLKPRSGRVILEGRDLASFGKRERASRVSFLFQGQAALWPFTVKEFVSQGRYALRGLFAPEAGADKERVEMAIGEAGLLGYEERLVTELSGGEFQRVLIARARSQEASLIIMDEPINNLDPKYQFVVMDMIRSLAEQGLSIILSLHDLTLANAYAHRIALAAGGKIAAIGKPAEILREEILSEVFEIPQGYQKYVLPRNFPDGIDKKAQIVKN
ncbi:MAG: ABC transporter ATP-binding protein [Treponema sp.]|jgi:iron complex transport system ATP-binding protein|nr:ABC transporter ATP-binding protein [Treponema sp.]